ncbi:rhamnan synthesis F family protein [Arthrobacter sp. 2YAF22_2]
MAHYDVKRVLRRHTLNSILMYSEAADQMVLVSTSGLQSEYLDKLPKSVTYIERDNFGYDFFSYKWGLDTVDDYADFDRVLIVNDSFVGPLVPLEAILESENCSSADFAGLTLSERHSTHAQSFFFTFTSSVSKSKSFRSFWGDMVPVSDRFKVISAYEIGLTTAVRSAGFKAGAYFVPSLQEEALARSRWEWHLRHRVSLKYPDKTVFELAPDGVHGRNWNPAIAFADRILDGARMPILKFDVLRFDPYELGAAHLLSECERAMPDDFLGVRAFLDDTRRLYPFRPGEINLPTSAQELRDSGIGYGHDPELVSMSRPLQSRNSQEISR